jgi:protein ImuB
VLQRFVAENPAASGRPLPNAGDPVFDVLRRWGLTTLGELAALPAAALAARLGSRGAAMQRLARGLDPRPLVPDPGTPRFQGSFELDWPIETLEPLSFVFARVLDPLAAALARADRGAVAIRLDLRLTDRRVHTRGLQLPVAMRDPRVLRTLLLLDLESHPPPAAVDVVSIELDPAPARIVQYSLLERAVPAPETLATLTARLGALVGETRCGSAVVLDSHRPDGFAMREAVFGERAAAQASVRVGAGSAIAADGIAQGSPPPVQLRRFRPPVAVRVAVEAGRPVGVAIDRRGMPGGSVRQAAGPWRVSGGWWEPERWNRDEWDVALGDGSVCRLVRDRETGKWFVEGVFD